MKKNDHVQNEQYKFCLSHEKKKDGNNIYITAPAIKKEFYDGSSWFFFATEYYVDNSTVTLTGQATGSGSVNSSISVTLADNLALPGTGGITLASGTTAQRAGIAGTIRFNSETSLFESTADGSTWLTIDTAGGTVTSVATGTGLSGGPITSTGTISIADTGVTPDTYQFSQVTINAQGQITDASSLGSTGVNNTLFVGENTGNSTYSGNGNCGFGSFTLNSLTSGYYNAAFGPLALQSNEDGYLNIAFGPYALNANISGSETCAFGYSAGAAQTEYNQCLFLGNNSDALANNLTNAIAIGYRAFVGVSNALVLGNGTYVGIANSYPAYTLDLGLISSECGIRLAVSSTPTTPTNYQDFVLFNNAGIPSYVDTGGTVYALSTTVGTVTSVSGTTNRITSTGGATPVIDISASYVGQTSITTLGTIGTGTWNGSVIAGTYGGTGVNNGTKTITLGGNLTTSGAFNSTFTMTGTTNVTFPTSGTLSTTTGTVTSVATGTGLSGGPITSTGTISIANTGVTAGTYQFLQVAINAQGQATSASSLGVLDATYQNLMIGNGITSIPAATIAYNTVIGFGAAPNLTTGAVYVDVFGNGAGAAATTVNQMTAFGSGALASTNANQNTAFGYLALNALTNNSLNTLNVAVGNQAGNIVLNASGCVFIGWGSNFTSSSLNLNNSAAIGTNAKIAVSNGVSLGNLCNVGIGQTSPLYSLDLGNTLNGSSLYCGARFAATLHTPSTPGNTNDIVIFNNAGAPSWIDTSGVVHALSTSTGTVTNVTGTSNQIGVATGTTTPVISLSSTLVAPGTIAATTSITSNTGTTTAVSLTSVASEPTITFNTSSNYLQYNNAGGGFTISNNLSANAGNTYDLGSSSILWANVYTNKAQVGGGINDANTFTVESTGATLFNVNTSTPTITLNASQIVKRTATATSYTVLSTDYVIAITSTSAARTITLPAAAGGNAGQIYIVKDESGGANTNNITVVVSGGGNIDGVTSYIISQSYGAISFYSNGTQWYVW